MSRRNEDFDEFCDPDNPKLILMDDVMAAAIEMKNHIICTPCIPSHQQTHFVMKLYYKLEIMQKSGCFKERGMLNALDLLPLEKQKLGVVVASLGNAAIGICLHAMKIGIPVIAVMPTTVPIAMLQRCFNYGAKVIVQGGNLIEAQRYGRAIARDKGLTYLNSRDHPQILAGYGSLALEILEQVPFVDAVVVSVGSGGLAAAVATVIKTHKPGCIVYGVQPEAMPVFHKSLEDGEPATVPQQPTLADNIAITHVGVNSFFNAEKLLDKLVLVKEEHIARAMLHLAEKERMVVEAAGACPLAAIIGNLVPELKLKHVVCVLSGGNVDTILYARCLDRGLAAEGRLVKFRVGINDNAGDQTRILKLLEGGGYNMVQQFQEHRWIENEHYLLEMRFVVATKGFAHALELKRIIERAYPLTAVFENEPFNDKRTCPCYVRKSM